jgi:hypothetical protein
MVVIKMNPIKNREVRFNMIVHLMQDKV